MLLFYTKISHHKDLKKQILESTNKAISTNLFKRHFSVQSDNSSKKYSDTISHKMNSLIVILSIVLTNTLFSQSFYSVHYNTNSGLSSSEVYHVMQDSKGYVWFCTSQGACRYDGYNFQTYDNTNGLIRNTVFEAYEDYKGRIWFTSLTDDLCYFYNNKFYPYAYNDTLKILKLQNLRGVSKSTFFVDTLDNIYYTRYYEKPVKIDKNGNAEWIDLSDQKHSIIVKIREDGKLLNDFSLPDTITYIQDNNNFIPLKTEKHYFKSVYSKSLATDSSVIVYSQKTAYVINRQSGEYKKYDFDNYIIWLSIDSKGIIWIGFREDGAYGYENCNLKAHKYHLLTNHSVSSVLRDTEGAYWLTTLNDGAYYFPSLEIKTIADNNSIIKPITSITSDNKKIWFGGKFPETYFFDGNNLQNIHWIKDKNTGTRKLIYAKNKLFILTTNFPPFGLIVDTKNQQIKQHKDFFSNVREMADGNLLFSSANHNYMIFKKDSFIQHHLSNDVAFKNIYDICPMEDGSIWCATERGLVIEKNNRLINMADSNALYSNRITCLIKNKQNIWMGTKGAGILYKTQDSLFHYTTKEGLISNSISDIIINKDSIWIATNKGVQRFVTTPDVNDIQSWSTTNGVISNEVNDIELFKENIYVATSEGLCYFSKSMKGRNTAPPPIYLNKIEINDRDTLLLPDYKLLYTQNYISFNFIGLSFKSNNPVRYKYKLVGVDNTWNFSTQTEARYPALKPGEYTFMVKAINNSGVESTSPAMIGIYIKTPIWQMLWFKITVASLLFILSLLIILFINQYRMNDYKRKTLVQNELNKYRQKALSAQMNPHFLYNSINSAQYFILNNNPETATDYLSNLGGLMRKILNNSMHETISLAEELDALWLYIEMEQRRFEDKFKFTKSIDKNVDLKNTKVPPLILQPYVENAIHHGLREKIGPQLLSIKITQQISAIIIEIKDNGVGRKQTENSKRTIEHISLGTEITRKRLIILEELHTNKMTVAMVDLYDTDGNAEGTLVTLTIKQIQ